MTILKAVNSSNEHTLFIGDYSSREEAQEAVKVMKAVGQWPRHYRAKVID